MKSRLALLFLLLLAPHFVQADGSYFMTVKLPRGVEIDLPKDWRLFSNEQKKLIETSAEAAMDNTGIEMPKGTEVNLLSARAMPESMYAAAWVYSSTPIAKLPLEVKNMSSAEIIDYGNELKGGVSKLLPQQGYKLLQFNAIRRVTISGYPAFIMDYRRSGLKGPVMVRAIQIYTPSQELNISLSYRESETAIWKPVIDKAFNSIVVRKWP